MKITAPSINFKANKMTYQQANYLDKELKNSQNVDIICHSTSDRDSANSAAVLWKYLNSQGINSRIIISQNLASLNFSEDDCVFVQDKDEEQLQNKPDTVLCIDFSQRDRIRPNVLDYIDRSNKILGIDHHYGIDIVEGNYVVINKQLTPDEAIRAVGAFYTDTSAKSASSIVYRFLKAIDEKIDNETAYRLFCGLVDDCTKKNLVDCDGIKGTITTEGGALEKDYNALSIFNSLKSKLSEEQIAKIAKDIDIMASLTKEEKEFTQYLDGIKKYSKNSKIAYIELPPDDEHWIALGRDNVRTSSILNRYRQKMLKEKDVKLALAFYDANGTYRLSAHSNDESLLHFFKYLDETIPRFSENSGGHPSRGGARLLTDDTKSCHNWVNRIIESENFYD